MLRFPSRYLILTDFVSKHTNVVSISFTYTSTYSTDVTILGLSDVRNCITLMTIVIVFLFFFASLTFTHAMFEINGKKAFANAYVDICAIDSLTESSYHVDECYRLPLW